MEAALAPGHCLMKKPLIAATTEARSCCDQDVYIVGGGNSAGQAAMYLSQYAQNVYILIRKADLSSSMSSYLIEQINATANIHVMGQTEVAEAHGQNHLEQLTLYHPSINATETVAANALFIFIGARPYTDWLPERVITNAKGFVETGPALFRYSHFKGQWKTKREPYLLETSIPGIFAAGDVRAGAMNRVASAEGEGAMAIKLTHQYFAQIG